jgi:hypothetical protein
VSSSPAVPPTASHCATYAHLRWPPGYKLHTILHKVTVSAVVSRELGENPAHDSQGPFSELQGLPTLTTLTAVTLSHVVWSH